MSLRHAPWEEAAEFRIGLRPVAEEAWLEGGEADPAARKDPLFEARRSDVWAALAGSEPAQIEALQMISGAAGRPLAAGSLPPLYAAAREVADDLCIMERLDGAWSLTALSLSAGTFFTASEVIGRSLAELHRPVAGFDSRLLPRVERIFDALRPELILERRNWTVVNTPDLFTPSAEPMRSQIGRIAPEEAGQRLHLRVERQTVRRLPRTGAVLFTIRVWVDPLERLTAEPSRLARFAQAWRTASPEFRAYKKLDLYDDLVAAFVSQPVAQT
jgi:hypothetical protein